MIRVLDLFSGVGGFSLGLERTGGFETVAFCEIDPFCRAVLRKHWPDVPQFEDIRSLTAKWLTASGISVDAICGGFPCQDISIAGRGAGIDGERSGLWADYARIVGELRPSIVIVENVAALLKRGMGRVLGDLAELGYHAEWHRIQAARVGARHIRNRIWIIAYPHGHRLEGTAYFAHSLAPYVGTYHRSPPIGNSGSVDWEGWASEPAFLGKGDDVPNWAYRVDACGNAVVPQIPEIIGRAILRAMAQEVT